MLEPGILLKKIDKLISMTYWFMSCTKSAKEINITRFIVKEKPIIKRKLY